ncbi:metallophosphoesterase [Rubripirellula amarantea]|uniref:Calcineurin-like phosphoesterase domain-containing protein n=1 Tax=Rubripirellula amarantea TaxID=2527999 RepID=A0A5C5WJF8_9BACT|nr:metallophosphoesterase [Rubripirellula amarantea]MDA8746036.1 metallophosphoesterase [Rubripirellula amarantea]TWT50898.1 hypothetical protein Pla22_36410 [Rubripirellula amarantea]
MKRILGVLLFAVGMQLPTYAEITRIWLTHRTNVPDSIVVNWESDLPGTSEVQFGPTADYGKRVTSDDETSLHHVEIPVDSRDGVIHYRVKTGDQRSADAVFKTYPTNELRIAVIADWQGRPDLKSIRDDDVHLIATAGDNITSLWSKCGNDNHDCIVPYLELIDAYPDLFRSTPLMPVLGNHDREIRPRGTHAPDVPVYDVDAKAFRRFFELPDQEWKWQFAFPDFGLRLVGLDLSHILDSGTTWQTCHAYGDDSEQFRWYQSLPTANDEFMVTLYNEQNSNIRRKADNKWHDLFRRGTCCISGFGYFAERAVVDDFTYYNTSLSGKGDQYPDPDSEFLASEDNYILLSVQRHGGMTVNIKTLDGTVIDSMHFDR